MEKIGNENTVLIDYNEEEDGVDNVPLQDEKAAPAKFTLLAFLKL